MMTHMFILACLIIGAACESQEKPNKTAVSIAVRPTDLDQKKHVNHSKYLEYLQVGRWNWLSRHEVANDLLEDKHGVTLVVVNVNLDYKRPIHYGDTVNIHTSAAKKSDKVIVFRQSAVNGSGEEYAAGSFTCVCVSMATSKSIAMPEELSLALAEGKQ